MDDDATKSAELQWKAEFLAMAALIQETEDAPDADHVGADGDPYAVCSGDAYGAVEAEANEEQEAHGLVPDTGLASCEDTSLGDDVEDVEIVIEDDEAAAGEEDDVEDDFYVDTAGQQTDADTSVVGVAEISEEDVALLQEASEVCDDQALEDAIAEENLIHADEEEVEDCEQEDEQEDVQEQPEHCHLSSTIVFSNDATGDVDHLLGPECSGETAIDNEPELAHPVEESDAGEVAACGEAFFPLLAIAASAIPVPEEQEDALLQEGDPAAIEEDAIGEEDLLDIEQHAVAEQELLQDECIDQPTEQEDADMEQQLAGQEEFVQEEDVDESAEQGSEFIDDAIVTLAGAEEADDHLGEGDPDMSESQLDFAADNDDVEFAAAVDSDDVELAAIVDSDGAEFATPVVEDDVAEGHGTVDAGADFQEAFDDLPEDAGEIDNCESADIEIVSDGIGIEEEEVADGEYPDDVCAVDLEPVVSEEVVDSVDPSASIRTGNENGYVFLCNNNTQKECATLKLLGSPEKEFDHMKHTIKPDTQLFLFNFQSWKLLGTFVVDGEPQKNIVPSAFMRRFSAQVRVVPVEPLCEVKISKRLEAGEKSPDEVMALVDSLLNAGAASDAIQRAWNSEVISEPPAKKVKLGGHLYSPMGTATSLMMPKPKRAPKPDSSSLAPTVRGEPVFLGRPRFDGTIDQNGRPFNLRQVVVNFANVGASFAEKVLGRDSRKGDRMFDWEGVRRCIQTLTGEQGMQVIGVLFENFKGPDNGRHEYGVPADIGRMCTFIQETPRLTGRNHKSADDEVTIKCAFRRNCRFLDNDNYRDWLNHMSNEKVRIWLENRQELLQMRYFFDAQMGTFDTLDGNIPAGLLASGET